MTRRLEMNDFFTYCRSTEMELLKEDIVFIYECCVPYPYQDIKNILHQYIKIWKEACKKCEIVYRKNNYARKLANSFLFSKLGKKEKEYYR